jgi:hypothetical protein
MSTIRNHGLLRSARSARLAGLAACALLAAACDSGLYSPASPSAGDAASLAPTGGDEVSSGRIVLAAGSGRATYEMSEIVAGHSGTCTIASARLGFRLKAEGQATPDSVIRFHLIRSDGFRTTAYVDVSRQGTFRTGQELVTTFPAGIEVRCVLLSVDGLLLAESVPFNAP